MKKKLQTTLMGAVGAMLLFAACTSDSLPEVQNPPETGDADQVTFIARNFVREGMDSRTAIVLPENLNDQTQGTDFVWTAGDSIGVAPANGAQAYFVIAEGAGSNQATFTGGDWALKTGESSNYAAYYPFIGDIFLKRTEIPVNYIGQKYIPADSETHKLTSLAAFDYMAAKPTQASSTSNVNFEFKHLSALVEVKVTIPTAGSVNRLILSSDSKVIPVQGTFDLTAETVAITSTEEDYSLFVDVEGLTTTVDRETVSIFFMMPPIPDVNISDLTATVLYGDENKGLPLDIITEGTLEAGKYYTLETQAIEQPEALVISFAEDIAHEAGTYLYQWGFTKLRFVAGSTVVSEVKRDFNGLATYVVRNGDWLELHTLAKAFKLPENCDNMFNSASYSIIKLHQLTEMDLRGFDTSSVTTMNSMFKGCSSLTSLDLRGFDTSSVTIMESMFNGCSSLTSLDLRGFDTSSVLTMNSMFKGCSSLTSLDLSTFNTSKVRVMESMFEGCSSLASLNLSSFNTWHVYSMDNMFKGCSSLASLDLSSFNTWYIQSMNYMFYNCFSLISLDLSGLSKTPLQYSGIFSGVGSHSGSKTKIFVTSEFKEFLEGKNYNVELILVQTENE